MRDETEFVVVGVWRWCGARHRCHPAVSFQRSCGTANNIQAILVMVAGCYRQLEVLIDPLQASEDGLPNAPHAKVLLDTLADRLAQLITRMPCRASVDSATTALAVILRYIHIIYQLTL